MRRFGRLVLVSVISILLVSCELEEDFVIKRDGSGTYTVKLLIPKQFAKNLGDVPKEADEKGFRFVEQGETETHKYFVFAKDFKNVAEVAAGGDTYKLDIAKANIFRTDYNFNASVTSGVAQGFRRRMRVTLPVSIDETTAGDISGRSVSWDCTTGGNITILAAGTALPLTELQRAGVFAVLAAAIIGFVVFRFRRRTRASVCTSCGQNLLADARFCPKCGHAAPATGVSVPSVTTIL
jgi:hypothetical protein